MYVAAAENRRCDLLGRAGEQECQAHLLHEVLDVRRLVPAQAELLGPEAGDEPSGELPGEVGPVAPGALLDKFLCEAFGGGSETEDVPGHQLPDQEIAVRLMQRRVGGEHLVPQEPAVPFGLFGIRFGHGPGAEIRFGGHPQDDVRGHVAQRRIRRKRSGVLVTEHDETVHRAPEEVGSFSAPQLPCRFHEVA
ncbi:hypothetical protein [Streptomyces neyagawaensis]|uniref:hypothetical protein n=1 Tax=Streptomyces neyagawaensis TaxID=42238 RepID=UPI0006E2C630|nr:hypothetical protein [Streptomyces neyagawaensis]MCL6732294.1 hypothetical protein [Streptomyces neyagawaensis]MDE1685775.1 hypothetical protein [Streptomyces neyagawaensis]